MKQMKHMQIKEAVWLIQNANAGKESPLESLYQLNKYEAH